MKKILTLLSLLCALLNARALSVDPPHWWTGMKDTSLQLQLRGTDIRSADVKLAPYPGVILDSVVRPDRSPNYLFLYLNISAQAKPGTLNFALKSGKKTEKLRYELRARRPQRGAQGFDASDVLYMVMPDRFADGNPGNNLVKTMRHPVGADRTDLNVRHGGDLKGIAGHVGYLDSLGITALWLNPVLENDMPGGSYHGYATTDYYRVDPRFGTNAEYIALIDTLHSHGIKTVMDMIFNHSGSAHPWAEDPPYEDWINFNNNYTQTTHHLSSLTDPYASRHDRTLATDGWFVREMPDLNQRNPHLLKYLIQNAIFWVEEAQIDAIRMDTYPYADAAAMDLWIDAMMAEYPQFNIVGECWYAQPANEATWQKGSALSRNANDSRLATVMDFPLMMLSRNLEPYREPTNGFQGLAKVYNHLGLDYIYADPMRLLRFLDNHDTERVLLQEPDSLDAWKQAVALLLTVPGIPQVYYGTELLMNGDRRPGDGNVRRDMPGGFPGDKVNAFTPSGRTPLQNEAFDYLSTLLKWRRTNPAIAKGKMIHFAPDNGLYLYKRYLPDSSDEVLVMLNGTDAPLTVDMTPYAEAVNTGDTYTDVLTSSPVTITQEMTFAPRAVCILTK